VTNLHNVELLAVLTACSYV